MVFFSNKNTPSLNLFLNGHKLTQVGHTCEIKTTKFLGIHIDSNLNWEHHIEKVANKMRSIIHLVSSVKKSMPVRLKIMLYKSLLIPHVIYCLPIYGTGKGVKKIETYMKWAIRICANLRYNGHTNNTFPYYKTLKFEDLYKLQLLLLARKFIAGALPSTYTEFLSFHSHKNRRENVFTTIMPSYKTRHTIYETLPKLWNQEKRDLEKSQNIFKSRFKETCFNNYSKIKCTKRKCYSCGRN